MEVLPFMIKKFPSENLGILNICCKFVVFYKNHLI